MEGFYGSMDLRIYGWMDLSMDSMNFTDSMDSTDSMDRWIDGFHEFYGFCEF
jgi:hypothetical protein